MSYQRKQVHAPRLAGFTLRLFAWLVERPILGWGLRKMLSRQVGMTWLREQPATATPLWAPLHEASGFAGVEAEGRELAEGAIQLPHRASSGFRFESILDFHEAYCEGRTTPVEVARSLLAVVERSEQGETPLRVFIAQSEEDLLQQAEASAERHRRGEPLGPLDGVPVAVKDELDQLGYPTTAGTRVFGDEPATREATAVGRMRAAGALLVGKTNMHELGAGVTGLNPHHGPARNPYDPTRLTGGSSSATAAAVAAGFCPVSIGCDGGGSIRIPASLCGVVGLKATFGRISDHGAFPLCWSVAHVGPFGATARDAAAAYALLAGPDPADPHTLSAPPVELDRLDDSDLSGVRLGLYRPWFEDADPAIVSACRGVVELFESLGAEIVDVEIPHLDLARVVHLVTIVSEMCSGRLLDSRKLRTRFGHDIRINLAVGYTLSGADYVHALRHRRRIVEGLEEIFTTVDGILTPSTACTAPPVPLDALRTGETKLELLDRLMRFAPVPNLTGHPAISFPVGNDPEGLPIGCQVIGRAWSESLLLRLAHLAEGSVERNAPRWHAKLLEGVTAAGASSTSR